jgi:hypothetical protein
LDSFTFLKQALILIFDEIQNEHLIPKK